MKKKDREGRKFGIVSALAQILHLNVDTISQFGSLDKDSLNRFRNVSYVNTADLKEELSKYWLSISEEEVKEALDAITKTTGTVRCLKPGRWKVEPLRKILPDVKPREGWGRKKGENRPGKCPVCGFQVEYKNRHARSGKTHTGEQCNLNRIRSVMEG